MSGQEVLLTCQKVLDLEHGPQPLPPADELWAQAICSYHCVYLLHSSALFFCLFLQGYQDFPGNLDGKESTCNAGDPGLIPGWGRSPGEGNDNHSSTFAWEIPWTGGPWAGCSPWSCK